MENEDSKNLIKYIEEFDLIPETNDYIRVE